ncbi:phage portal protein [Mesorhizobium sp. M0496]|uniref:phage portal protein n=1 Tax=Mesorhizobium sp. M0496 TaxID=2956952 RepID=UPI00333C6A57
MRLWPFRTSAIETKSATLAEPDAELFELFTGIPPGSLAVSAATALTVPAVSAAVRTISEAAATLDICVERKTDGKWAADDEHPAAMLLHGQVNDWTSGFEFIRDLTAQALTSDYGGLAWVGRAGGKSVEIIHYRPGTISVEYPDDTGEPKFRRGGTEIQSADIIHLRSPFSRCPLSLAREAIGAAKEMERHAGNLFKKGARPGGVIEFPVDAKIGSGAIARIKAAWTQAHEGSDNAGKTAVLFNGGKFNALTMLSTDAQFLELRKFQVLEIARAFRTPPHMLYELDRATWSNSEQMGREFLVYCLEPWLRALEGCLTRALIAPDDRATTRIRFDRDDLTRASLTERATAINSLRASEVLSADEGRSWIDLPPRADGKGGTYENPNITIKPAAPEKLAAA